MRYINTVESLERNAELYLNRREPYIKTDDENRVMFAAIIESIATNELENWENLQVESFHYYSSSVGVGMPQGA